MRPEIDSENSMKEGNMSKGLTVPFLIALAGPVSGKLFCGGTSLCICHGGVSPIHF